MRNLEEAAAEQAGDDTLTPAEIHEAIEAFGGAEWTKLISIAKWLSARSGIPEADLRQEAMLRALQGRRVCRRNDDILRFLAGVMKSIASAENEARRTGNRPVLAECVGFDGADRAADTPSPEQRALSTIQDGETLARISEAIADDEDLQLLVEGLCDNMRGEQLEKLLGVDTKGLAAIRKRLKRRLEGLLPGRTGR